MSYQLRIWCPQCGKSCGRIVRDQETSLLMYIGQNVPDVRIKANMPKHHHGKTPHRIRFRSDDDLTIIMCARGHRWRLSGASVRRALQSGEVELLTETGEPLGSSTKSVGRSSSVEFYQFYDDQSHAWTSTRIDSPIDGEPLD